MTFLMRPDGDPLDSLLDEWLPHRDATSARFLPALLGSGEGIAAVVYYGSRLSGAAAADSEPDFYLVVDSLARYAGTWRKRLLGPLLPPLVLHLRLDDGAACKLCVVSALQLRRETSPEAADVYHLGRFSKRVGLVYARDSAAWRTVREAQRAALETLADHTLALLPRRFTLDEFLLALLGLSYRGEPRVVEPGKVEALFAAHREAYRRIGILLLCPRAVAECEGQRFLQPSPSEAARAAALRLLRRSRLRALLRWPKHILTFEGWADYAIRKVERNTGRALVLTPRARRHPLLFGWPQLLALRRAGVVR